ncbi:MAG TPA: ECF transporter S component, partial [Clostridiales bacterium]|nr:ECF transporter S component [Clostridiales bacterium]
MENTNNTSRSKTLRLTQLGILSAIIIIMAFTPLGYLRIGPLSITFLTVPVIIGAMLLGPTV